MKYTEVANSILRAKVPEHLGAVSAPLTVNDAAEALTRMRRTLAAAWPAMKARLRAQDVTPAEMRQWNDAVSALVALELKFVARLSKLGVKTTDGKPLADVVHAGLLEQNLGIITGVPANSNGKVGVVPLAILAWIGVALVGVLVADFAALIMAEAVESFNREDIVRAEASAELASCVARGDCTSDVIDKYRNILKEDRLRREGLPGWAKGAIAVGASALVLGVAYVVFTRLEPKGGKA